MHREVQEQPIPFAGRQRLQRVLHIVKHLAEDPEIKIRAVERQIPQHAGTAYDPEKQNRGNGNQNHGFLFCKRLFEAQPAMPVIILQQDRP